MFCRRQAPETRNVAKFAQPSPAQPSLLRRNVPKIRKSQKAQNPAETPKSGQRKTFSAVVGTHTSRKRLWLENIPSKFRDSDQIPTPSYPGTCQKSDMSKNPKSSIRVEKFCFSKNESFGYPCIAPQIPHPTVHQVDSLLPPEKLDFQKIDF